MSDDTQQPIFTAYKDILYRRREDGEWEYREPHMEQYEHDPYNSHLIEGGYQAGLATQERRAVAAEAALDKETEAVQLYMGERDMVLAELLLAEKAVAATLNSNGIYRAERDAALSELADLKQSCEHAEEQREADAKLLVQVQAERDRLRVALVDARGSVHMFLQHRPQADWREHVSNCLQEPCRRITAELAATAPEPE